MYLSIPSRHRPRHSGDKRQIERPDLPPCAPLHFPLCLQSRFRVTTQTSALAPGVAAKSIAHTLGGHLAIKVRAQC